MLWVVSKLIAKINKFNSTHNYRLDSDWYIVDYTHENRKIERVIEMCVGRWVDWIVFGDYLVIKIKSIS